ncbi:hypothetical protein BCR44DRAFT_1439181, partial [Catenaria anguillulae PL171]
MGVPLVGVDAAVRLGWNVLDCQRNGCSVDPVEQLDHLQDHILINDRLSGHVEVGIEFWGYTKLILSAIRSLYMPHLGMDSSLASLANALLCLSYPGGKKQAKAQCVSGVDKEVYDDITKSGTNVFKDILTAYWLPLLDAATVSRKGAARGWDMAKMPLV